MRHLLATATVVALLSTTGGAVGAQEASPEPGASPSPEQLAAAEERLATATCLGKPATIVAIDGFETVGTPGADVIVGTEGDDIIRAEGGSDRICSGPGADTIDGGPGNDTIDGGPGPDKITGAAGKDRLTGAAGDDTLNGGKGKDVCVGGKGIDWLPSCNEKRATRGTITVTRNTKLKGPHKGFIVIAANKVTLDCGGYTVMGPGGGIGISVVGWNGNTVRNCDVTNFNHGITLAERAKRNTLTRNRVHGNSVEGIRLEGTSRNKVTSNIADDNGFGSGHAYQVLSSQRNVFKNNSACTSDGKSGGFSIGNGSSNNSFENNTVTGGRVGFHIFEGGRNKFRGNTVTGTGGGFVSEVTTSDNGFADNVVTGVGDSDAYYFAGAGHSVVGNTAIDNSGIGFTDHSVPGANSYADNVCSDNREGGSEPEGLCDDNAPVEPEPTTQPSDLPDAD